MDDYVSFKSIVGFVIGLIIGGVMMSVIMGDSSPLIYGSVTSVALLISCELTKTEKE